MALGVVTLMLLAGCSSNDTSARPKIPKPLTFTADVRLSGANNLRGSIARCAGAGQFADLQIGSGVIIADASGAPIAFGVVSISSGTNTYQGYLDECVFQFRAVNVPSRRKYFIIVGRQSAQPVERATIIRSNFRFALDVNPPNVSPPTAQG